MDKLKFWALTFLSFSLFCLALSLAYVAYEVGKTTREAPQLLEQVSKTSEKLAPIVKETAKIRQAIPPILDQVEATRKEIPAILSSIDNVSAAAQAITKEVGEVRVIMPDILAELRKTREALPGILQQADQVASKAQSVAREGGKKAAGGVIEGIVASPFTIAADLGRSMTSSLRLKDTKGLKREDFELIRANVLVILEDDEIGSTTTWENPEEKNRGTATLIRQFEKNGMSCKEIQITIWSQEKKIHDSRHEMCRQADGTWIETKGKIFN
jgi:surface antigen